MALVAGSYSGLSVADVATVASRNADKPVERKPASQRRKLTYAEVLAERAKKG